ncbi:MAG: winged helix-turn-helix domain-containing protein [Paludibacter sp.]
MLNEEIGNNAGLVWSALVNGELNVKAVKKATKLTEKDLNLALGWLAREGKIQFNEVDGELLVALV